MMGGAQQAFEAAGIQLEGPPDVHEFPLYEYETVPAA